MQTRHSVKCPCTWKENDQKAQRKQARESATPTYMMTTRHSIKRSRTWAQRKQAQESMVPRYAMKTRQGVKRTCTWEDQKKAGSHKARDIWEMPIIYFWSRSTDSPFPLPPSSLYLCSARRFMLSLPLPRRSLVPGITVTQLHKCFTLCWLQTLLGAACFTCSDSPGTSSWRVLLSTARAFYAVLYLLVDHRLGG